MAKAQIINIDGNVIWEKQADVRSEEDTTVRCIKLEYPADVSSAHFIKLYLTEGDNIVSDNFYIRGVEEGNYRAINDMPSVKLQQNITTSVEDGEWRGSITLKNESDTPALMIRINVVGAKDGEQILPIFYSDNYFSLLPNEKKQIDFHWKDIDSRGNKPKVIVSGFNVE